MATARTTSSVAEVKDEWADGKTTPTGKFWVPFDTHNCAEERCSATRDTPSPMPSQLA
ncbi:hypothetical protein ABIB57_000628 [Devosia sp. UYZn731]